MPCLAKFLCDLLGGLCLAKNYSIPSTSLCPASEKISLCKGHQIFFGLVTKAA